MSIKRGLWGWILLAAVLVVTGCAGRNTEVEAAKADYIRAKARLVEAKAQKAEQESANLQLQRELARADAELATERSRRRQQALIEIGQVAIPGGLGVGALLALLHALRPLIRTWTEQRVRRLRVEAQTLDKRIRCAELEKSRLKHERISQEAQARNEEKQQETLRLQIQLTQAQARLARERRWREYTHRAQGVPLGHETVSASGSGH